MSTEYTAPYGLNEIALSTLQASLNDTTTKNLMSRKIDSHTIYLPILKCASTWMSTVTASYEHTQDRQAERVLIVVRDPLERWISGMCTYARLMHTLNWSKNTTKPAALLEELIIQTETVPWLDTHCLPMHYYVQHLSIESITAFKLETLKTSWAQFTQSQIPDDLYRNRSQDHAYTAWVRPVIEKLYQTIKLKVDYHLESDYELLRTVRYYS